MKYLQFVSEYDRYPETRISGYDDQAWQGWNAVEEIIRSIRDSERVLIVDCYPGVDDEELLPHLITAFQPETVIDANEILYSGEKLTEMLNPFLTEDRVRGKMCFDTVDRFIDQEKLSEAVTRLEEGHRTLIYGFAAEKICSQGILVLADMARWEIQLRYRAGMPNYKQNNWDEDILKKFKRGFFAEWRIADRHKRTLYDRIDFYLDTNTKNEPHMITGAAFREGLRTLTRRPFRLVPYFDPGVWGGQWMKEVCHLDPDQKNYAWSFDGVPEENSIYLKYGDVRVESPAMNLTLYQPKAFLGQKNYARFGAEYPIRFDFLDTMDGQNLSLQVHPLTDYIFQKFGMNYTQDESYYILDRQKEGGVYLGLKEDIDPEEMVEDLKRAQNTNQKFAAEKYVNFWPAKKFDHFLIPAGTVHCSSKDCMVLEVSATPYIFTFKLWDWDRVGLDGKPRPIHIDDGEKVIQFDRRTRWVQENLIDCFEVLEDNDRFREVKTGLHELEFIETHVFDIYKEVLFKSDGEFCMCNLVDGKSARIESTEGRFEPFTVHYAETFILPAQVGDVRILPVGEMESVKVLKANVRFM